MVTATTEPVRLPPGPRIPKPIQAVTFLVSNHANVCRRLPTVWQRRGQSELAEATAMRW